MIPPALLPLQSALPAPAGNLFAPTADLEGATISFAVLLAQRFGPIIEESRGVPSGHGGPGVALTEPSADGRAAERLTALQAAPLATAFADGDIFGRASAPDAAPAGHEKDEAVRIASAGEVTVAAMRSLALGPQPADGAAAEPTAIGPARQRDGARAAPGRAASPSGEPEPVSPDAPRPRSGNVQAAPPLLRIASEPDLPAAVKAPPRRSAAPEHGRPAPASQSLPVSVTLHAGSHGAQVTARIAGAPEAELARLAEEILAQGRIPLSSLVVNGRRIGRDVRR